jgi:hypothetical protein
MAFASLESTSPDWRGVMILSASSKGFDMSQEATSKFAQFRGAPLARRIGSVALGAWIVLYLAVITYTFSDRLDSMKHVTLLFFLWLIGVLALGLLSRAWRKPGSAERNTSARP